MVMHEVDPAAPDGEAGARRRWLQAGTGLFAAGLFGSLSACGGDDRSPLADSPTPTPTGSPSPSPVATVTPTIQALTDNDLLIFILQLTYLQAEFYSMAILGVPLPPDLAGAGAPAIVGPRQITFKTAALGEMFRELAFGKLDQLTCLREMLGSAAVSRPAVDLDVTENGVFTRIARSAAIVKSPETFDVYASEEAFLLASFFLEDIITAAYKGALPLFQKSATIAICGGLLATSACHTAMVRSQLYLRGLASGSTLRQRSIRLSDLRDSYDSATDLDQGVSGGSATTPNNSANVTNADGEGLIYGRPPQLTLNVVYLTNLPATSGGFFPDGLTGTIRQTART